MVGSTVWYGFPPYNPVRQIFYFRIGLILVTVAQNYGVIFSRGNFRYCSWPFTVGVTVRQRRVGTDTVGIPTFSRICQSPDPDDDRFCGQR